MCRHICSTAVRANCFDKYEPTVSSYDDDAPVNECGDLTDKYFRFREVISKYAPIPDIELPAAVKKKKYGKFEFTACRRLFDCLDKLSAPVETVCPLPMEKLGQGYGFILYRTEVRGPRETQNVRIQEPRDRAYIYKNNELLGVQYRNDREPAVSTDIPAEGATLSVLVENMGRVNYGAYLKDPKGVTEGIGFGWNFIYHWQTYPLPLDDLSAVHKYDDVRQLQRLVHVVGNKNNGFAKTLLQVLYLVLKSLSRLRIQSAEGLIHQHDRGRSCQRTQNTYTLLLPAGELRGILFRIVLHVDQLQHLLNSLGTAGLIVFEKLGHHRDILGHGHVWEQADLLDHIADMSAELHLILQADVLPIDGNGAAVRL